MKYEPETRNDGTWVRIEDYNDAVANLREALTPFVVNRSYNPEILVELPPDPMRLCAPLNGPMSIVIELDDLRRAHQVMEETK